MLRELIGKLLREYREKAGLTQEKIAKACRTTKGEISKLESGKIKNPSLILILSYLKATGTPKETFFSKLDEIEIKEILPEAIEGYSVKAKEEIIRYATGVRYAKKGIIAFPEYARIRILSYLFSASAGDEKLRGTFFRRHKVYNVKPEEKDKYLAFAEEYFQALQTEEKKQLEALKEASERYERLGLNLEIMSKIKKIVIKALRREEKRSERKVIQPEKEKRMTIGYARYLSLRETLKERTKQLICYKKGAKLIHIKMYFTAAMEYYKILKKNKGSPPPEKTKEWLEKKAKEGYFLDWLADVMKIVEEEFNRLFFAKT